MARVPYNPTPNVAASGVPQDYENVRATPEEFGGQIGSAEQKLGSTGEQASGEVFDAALREQNLYNEANVNAKNNALMTGTNDILHKPESSPGAGDGGLFTKKGDNALHAGPDAQAALQKLYDDTRTSLPNAKQQIMFDQLNRRIQNYQIQSIGQYVDQEANKAADEKAQSLIGTLSSTATLAASRGDMNTFDEAVDQMKGTAKSWGERRGYGQDWGDQWSQKVVGQTVSNAALQLAQTGDLKGAAAMVDKYEPDMDKGSVLSVKTHLKGQMEDMQVDGVATKAVQGVTDSVPDIGAISQGIQKIERTGQNPKSSASGRGQFIDSTWLEQVKQSRPDLAGQSDDQILAMRSDDEFAGAITTGYAQSNVAKLSGANLPATPGNVYLAHFLGPDGAIKVLSSDPSTPISAVVSARAIEANPQLAGKTVGDIAKWASDQMAGVGLPAQVKMDKAQAIAQGQAAFPNDPVMQRKVTQAIDQKFTSIQLDAAARSEAATAANQQAAKGYLSKIMTGDTKGLVPQMAQDKALTYETQKSLFELATRKADGTDPPFDDAAKETYAKMVRMQAQNPDAFVKMDLTEPSISHVLPNEKLSKLMDDQATILKAKGQGGRGDEAQNLDNAYKTLHAELVHGNDYTEDPAGWQQYSQATIEVQQAYRDGKSRATPLTDAQMFGFDSKDNIVKPAIEAAKQRIAHSKMSDMTKIVTSFGPTEPGLAKPSIDLSTAAARQDAIKQSKVDLTSLADRAKMLLAIRQDDPRNGGPGFQEAVRLGLIDSSGKILSASPKAEPQAPISGQ